MAAGGAFRFGFGVGCVVLAGAVACLSATGCFLDAGPLPGSSPLQGGGGSAETASTGQGADGGVALLCGNEAVEGEELCDGANLKGRTCEGIGYPPGELKCTETCVLDASGCNQGEPWWDNTWGYRMRVKVDGSMTEGVLDDFTVLIPITNAALSNALGSGEDIVFIPVGKTAPLAHEIEYFNQSSGILIAWVRFPTIQPSQVYELMMYFGNPAAVPKSGSAWETGFAGVWHMSEQAIDAGTTTVHKNSAGADYDGEQNGNLSGPGKIGVGQSFDGTDWISIKNGGAIALSDATCSIAAWIRTTVNEERALITKTPNGTHGQSDVLTGVGHDGPYFGMDQYFVDFVRGTTNVTDGKWHYVVWSQTRNAGGGGQDEWRVFVDGAKEAQEEHHMNSDNSGHIIQIGKGVPSSYFSGSWKGQIDEVRISKVDRPAEWVLATFNNQNTPEKYVTHDQIQKVPPPPP
ncbi:MAG: DUF2341 domain-containing protein [Polyangiaceae bacterium]|nr:DUF2341 domain-containing protein [Polyangiaceae bacterium]